MIKSLKLITNYYRVYKKSLPIPKRLLHHISTFILIFFLFSYIFYYITNINMQAGSLKYADYDAHIVAISGAQAREIRNYDYVDKYVSYALINGCDMRTEESKINVSLNVIWGENLANVDYTPLAPKLILDRDENLVNNNSINPVLLMCNQAKQLKVEVGDKITIDMLDNSMEYTVAGIYSDAAGSSVGGDDNAFVSLNESLLDWLFKVEEKSDPHAKREDVACNQGYIKFNDLEKGHEFINNFYSDLDLSWKYGDDWPEKATEEELNNAKGSYTYRDRQYKVVLNNMSDSYARVICIVGLGFLALILFMSWEQNKKITMTMQSISVLIASGCRKIAIFIYFFSTTLLKQIGYFLVAMPLIRIFLVTILSHEPHYNWFFPWYLVTENLPFILLAFLTSALIVSVSLYIKLKRKIVLFTGEE